MKDIAVELLALIEQHEKIHRAVLANNVRNAMKQLELSEYDECVWLANLFNTTRNTTYSWLAPNRESKLPFKAVVRLAVKLNVPLQILLDTSVNITSEELRRNKERPNYRDSVLTCAEENPEWSVKQIALELKISENTVRRHLKTQI